MECENGYNIYKIGHWSGIWKYDFTGWVCVPIMWRKAFYQ